ncbi:tyrosine-type recombinase/integrase [Azospirillum brasilense]|uniref:tyrosine-type recombinase/integrase n=1 Tax=Azospirillum argentinense TaxID=2970906 RepID=UPI00190E88DF|nr:tyrosine-type recombinase/integrase [Azospirillum argentinense]MBK3800978.1 tyrosine-type recombinase/integrase [Azospirillum argentinense]
MASVRKRTLPSGKAVWQVDYKDQGGKRRSRQFKTKKEAESYETKVRGEVVSGIHTPDSTSITVAEAAKLWLETCEGESLQASTLKGYREYVKLHIVPKLGAVKVSRLTRPQVEVFKDELLKARSRVTARKLVATLGAILKDAMRRGLLAHNVAAGVMVKERRAEDFDEADSNVDAVDRIPSKEEVRIMLEKATELWPLIITENDTKTGEPKTRAIPWRPLVTVTAFTGMRISEVLGLTWQNVDLRAGLVKVRKRVDFQRQVGPVKSKMGRREIPIPPAVVQLLREWKMACPPSEMGLVFPFWDGKPMHYNVARKQCLRPLLIACGLVEKPKATQKPDEGEKLDPKPVYGFHDLRHFAASMFIELGWNAKRIQVLMGHSTITMTFDLYGHLLDRQADHSSAMAALESSLLGKK